MQKQLLLSLACLVCAKLSAQFETEIHHLSSSNNAMLRALSAHDIDGDGDLDALATYTNGVYWLPNDGESHFPFSKHLLDADLSAPSGMNLGSLAAQFRDLDADGLPDVAAGEFWCKNLGNGQFAAAKEQWWKPISTLCDVNNDGRADAIFYFNGSLFWCRNLGAGDFETQKVLSSNALSMRVFESVDLDLDGWEDLVLLRDNKLYWFKNLGNEDFQEIQIAASPTGVVEVEDLDNNGRPDLLASFSGQIRRWEFDLAGNVQERPPVPLANVGFGLALGDLDADGDQDLYISSDDGGLRSKWYAQTSPGVFDLAAPNILSLFDISYNIAALRDFDKDGHVDILGARFSVSNRISFFRNGTVAGDFDAPEEIDSPLSYMNQLFTEDLDADGDRDILGADFLFEKLAPGQYAERRKMNIPHLDVQLADLDGDGLKDAVYPKGDAVVWQRNLGQLAFGPAIELEGFVALCESVGVGDVDGDGDLDLSAGIGTEAAPNFEKTIWYENDGVGNFIPHELDANSSGVREIFPFDANDDGLLDLVQTFLNAEPARYYPNLGNGTFGPWQALFVPGTVQPAYINQRLVTDLDDDGKTDILYSTKDYVTTEVFWYQNLGGGVFSNKKILRTIPQGVSYGSPFFTVFDRNGDGIKDVIINADYNRAVIFLPGSGGGNFGPEKILFADVSFGGFRAIVPYDVDDDGKIDLLFGNQGIPNDTQTHLSWLKDKTQSPPPTAGCPTSVWYTKQSEIDSFPILYPGCQVIEGNVVLQEITGNNLPTIQNLNGFQGIHTVKGGVFIWRNHLQNLQGLDSLRRVDGNLEITNGLSLASLDGLGKLHKVGGEIRLGNNAQTLKNLQGLEALTEVGGDFSIFQQSLQTLNGLNGLHKVGGFLHLSCVNILNLHGLSNLDTVGSTLGLLGLKRVQNLQGLANLRYAGLQINTDSLLNLQGLTNWQAGKVLNVSGNKLLESLDGIEGLQRLDGFNFSGSLKYPVMWISGNAKLQYLSALDHAVEMDDDGIYVFQNPQLSHCGVEAICAYLATQPDTVRIADNLPECNAAGNNALAICDAGVALSAALSGGGEICVGHSFDLTVSFTGEGPYTFALALNGVAQAPITTEENPYTFPVNPSNGWVYTLSEVSNSQGTGSVSGAANFMLYPVPVATIAGPDTICLGDSVILTASGSLKYWWSTGATTAQVTVYPMVTTTYTAIVSNAYNCSDTVMWTLVVKNCASGAPIPGDLNQVNLFPNPVVQSIWLQVETIASAPLHIGVCDALGRQYWVGEALGSDLEIPVATWPPGVYFLNMRDALGRSVTRHFVIAR